MELKRVVITGVGALTPIGLNAQQYEKSLLDGVSGAKLISSFDTTHFKTKFACEIQNLNIAEHLDKKEINRLDRFSQLAIIASNEAIKQSGLASYDGLNKDKVGVIISSGIGGLITFQEEVKQYVQGGSIPKYSPFFIPKMILDIASGHISMRYGFRGINFSVVSACASSTHAMIDALMYIRLGKANAIIAGGTEGVICESGIAGFSSMKALSERNDDYKTASRPFDKDRDGFVMGEGAGILVLEELEHAKKRGANIIAELVGGGCSADAHHLTAPHPEGLGAKASMINAIEDAQITADKIDYINVHGTSTPLGDVAELKAITSVFGEHSYKINISSTKSMTGHLLGAAGAVEALACVTAVTKNIIPPTINNFNRDPEIDPKLNLTLNKAQERHTEYALSNTFGFGGHNATIIVKKYNG